jgi:tetratricopeptide (TPR) repeat protein
VSSQACRLLIIVMLLTLFNAGALQGADHSPQQRFAAANKAYNDGTYQEAIDLYRSLIGEYGLSVQLLHNLGNSYANSSQYGQAILQYQRALRLAPGDHDIRGDLELVRQKAGLFQEEKTIREKFFGFYDMNQWALSALTGYVFITLLTLLHLRFSLGKKSGAICLVLAAMVCVSALGARQQRISWESGVVILPDTRLLLSPFSSASSLGLVEEGSLLHSNQGYGDYLYIRDERGRSGWIPTSSFAPIPTSSTTYSQGDAAR